MNATAMSKPHRSPAPPRPPGPRALHLRIQRVRHRLEKQVAALQRELSVERSVRSENITEMANARDALREASRLRIQFQIEHEKAIASAQTRILALMRENADLLDRALELQALCEHFRDKYMGLRPFFARGPADEDAGPALRADESGEHPAVRFVDDEEVPA